MGADPVEKWTARAVKPRGLARRRRNAARRLAELSTPEAASGLALAAADSGDEAVVELARRTFAEVTDQEVIDAVCNVWWTRISTPLHQVIIENRWVATEPDNLRMLTALHNRRPEALAEGGRHLALLLLSVAGKDTSPLAERAREALSGLVAEEARDAVYAKALQDGDPVATEVALEDGFKSDPSRRALLLFLSGAFDRLAELDFDGRLLAAAYASADAPLRARLAARARASSRLEWVRAITGSENAARTDDPSYEEWSAAFDVLTATERWEELWRLALKAPPVWSARILRELAAHRWSPGRAADARGFERLAALAQGCADEPSYDAFDHESALLDDHGCASLAIAPDGRLAAAGSPDGAVRLWHLPSGESAGVLEGHENPAGALAFSPDGRFLISADVSGTILVRRLPSGEVASTISAYRGGVTCLAVSSDGKRLLSGGGGMAQLWSLPSGEFLAPLEHEERTVVQVAFTDGGKQIACRTLFGRARQIAGRTTGSIRLWGSPAAELEGRHDRPSSMATTPDGDLLIGGAQDGWTAIWRLPSGERINNVSGHKGPVRCLAVSTDGKLLVSGGQDGTVRVNRLPSATRADVLTGHDSGVFVLSLAADSRLLASAEERGTAIIWSLPSGEPVGKLTDHEGGIGYLAMAPDGTCIVSGSTEGGAFVDSSPDGELRFPGREPGTVRLWTAGVARAVHTPLPDLRPGDLARIRAFREHTAPELGWLDLAEALVRWRHRHDVEVGDAASPGPADIEIDQ